MLQRATFQNYRCLRDVTIEFGPLTVLVGGNGVGKSSLLWGLQPDVNFWERDAWRHVVASPPSARLEFDPPLQAIQKRTGASSALGPGRMPSVQLVRLDLEQLRRHSPSHEATRLDMGGNNLVHVFDTLKRHQQSALVESFCSLVPHFSDVQARPSSSGNKRIVFFDRWAPDLFYEPTEVSDGTMLVLAYLLLPHQMPQVDLLLIEEPEHGVHPYLLRNIVEIVRGMATGKIGPRPVQVVMATHSPQLVDCLEPEEIRFLSRSPDDGTVAVQTLSSKDPAWSAAFDAHDHSLGGIWLSGSAGGVP